MRHFLPVALALFLAACGGMLAPQTPREAYAAAEIAFTNTLEEIERQYSFGLVSQEDLDQAKPMIRAGNDALDAAAVAVLSGDEFTLDEQLRLVRALTDQLRALLLSRESSNGTELHPSLVLDPRSLAAGYAGRG